MLSFINYVQVCSFSCEFPENRKLAPFLVVWRVCVISFKQLLPIEIEDSAYKMETRLFEGIGVRKVIIPHLTVSAALTFVKVP